MTAEDVERYGPDGEHPDPVKRALARRLHWLSPNQALACWAVSASGWVLFFDDLAWPTPIGAAVSLAAAAIVVALFDLVAAWADERWPDGR